MVHRGRQAGEATSIGQGLIDLATSIEEGDLDKLRARLKGLPEKEGKTLKRKVNTFLNIIIANDGQSKIVQMTKEKAAKYTKLEPDLSDLMKSNVPEKKEDKKQPKSYFERFYRIICRVLKDEFSKKTILTKISTLQKLGQKHQAHLLKENKRSQVSNQSPQSEYSRLESLGRIPYGGLQPPTKTISGDDGWNEKRD